MKMQTVFNLIGFVIHAAFFLNVISADKKSLKQDKSADYGVSNAINDMMNSYFDSEVNIDPFENEKLRTPVVVNTWNYTAANIKAWESLTSGKSAVDSIVEGISVCEFDPDKCDRQVGFGDNPDENGETTLDAMIMDGNNMDTGGVGGIRRIKNAIGVAKYVLRNTKHSLIVGEFATDFAIKLGFQEESLSSNKSIADTKKWRFKDHCQPNFWVDVRPDPKTSCGPYTPIATHGKEKNSSSSKDNYKNHNQMRRNYNFYGPQNMFNQVNRPNGRYKNRNSFYNGYGHDTITMIAVNKKGEIAAGSSTNGLHHKIPGRVGDSPLPGSGVYADAQVGAAIATGDGDTMQRFVPSFFAVEEMRRGAGPSQAVHTAVRRIAKFYPNFWGAVVAVNKNGTFAAACSGMDKFPFSVTNYMLKETRVFWISCIHGDE